jgi:nucleotide-binding universal stress UspA family protein
MRNPIGAPNADRDARRLIERLLFIADAAVADVDELPPIVRAALDTAADVYVVTPTLPGRLAWLADDIDAYRHVADERLDTVLGHVRSIGVHASGYAGRGSVPLVISDAVAAFNPDHILIALRSAEHADWQERRLIEHIEERFHLPVTTYAVDLRGQTPAADGPVILCYDGSSEAGHAIEHAGRLLGGRRALVVTVQRPNTGPSSVASSGAKATIEGSDQLDRASADFADGIVEKGVRIAQGAGLNAEAVAVGAGGPVWKTILDIAERHDAAMIVMGSRGLTGVRAMLLGSVSTAVVHRADRPTLVIPQPVAGE